MRVVLEARSIVSRDNRRGGGRRRVSGALGRAVAFSGVGRLFEPLMQLVFNRVGAKASAGFELALNGVTLA